MKKEKILNSGDTWLGIRPCQCGDPSCQSMRIFIVNPQIDNDGVVYANVPPEALLGLVDLIIKHASSGQE
jgi:hypothetical protein